MFVEESILLSFGGSAVAVVFLIRSMPNGVVGAATPGNDWCSSPLLTIISEAHYDLAIQSNMIEILKLEWKTWPRSKDQILCHQMWRVRLRDQHLN